jgi:death-on-curing protein
MDATGGLMGIRDLGALESAIAQPYMTFDGNELYPSLAEKAAALGFSLIQNHPFADGNKRTGHAVMEGYLVANGYEIIASTVNRLRLSYPLHLANLAVINSRTGFQIIFKNYHD